MRTLNTLKCLALLAILFSCSEQQEPQPLVDAVEQATAKNGGVAMVGRIGQIAHTLRQLNQTYLPQNGLVAPVEPYTCPKVYFNPFELTLVVDFGEEGCTSSDGVFRSGRFDVQLLGLPTPSSLRATIVFKDFVSEGNTFDGAITFATRTNVNRLSESEIDLTMTDFSYTSAADGTTLALDGTFNMVWSAEETTNPINDSITITGSGNGTFFDGITYDFKITSPLIVRVYCMSNEGIYYPGSGKMQMTPFIGLPFKLDFGDGECDNLATMTIGFIDYPVELP